MEQAKTPQSNNPKELSYKEILSIMSKDDVDQNVYPNTFAAKVNSIFSCSKSDEDASE